MPGVEADDVIGTLATRALKEGMGVVVVSPDKVQPKTLSLACWLDHYQDSDQCCQSA